MKNSERKLNSAIEKYADIIRNLPWMLLSIAIITSYNYNNGFYFYKTTLCCFTIKAIWHLYCIHIDQKTTNFYTKYLKYNLQKWRKQYLFDKIRFFFFFLLLNEYGIFLRSPNSRFIWYPIVVIWVWESINQFFFFSALNYGLWRMTKYCFSSYFCIIRGLRFRSRILRLQNLLKTISTEHQFDVFTRYLVHVHQFYFDTLSVMGFTLSLWIIYNYKLIWLLLVCHNLTYAINISC